MMGAALAALLVTGRPAACVELAGPPRPPATIGRFFAAARLEPTPISAALERAVDSAGRGAAEGSVAPAKVEAPRAPFVAAGPILSEPARAGLETRMTTLAAALRPPSEPAYELVVSAAPPADPAGPAPERPALHAMSNTYTMRTDVRLSSGARFTVRPAEASDVSPVTALIHHAFEVWKRAGLSLGPMRQTDAETARHLLGKGYVVEDEHGRLAATFSLDEGAIAPAGAGAVDFYEGADAAVRFAAEPGAPTAPAGRLLVFKKFAVRPDLAHTGLGSRLYALAEQFGREAYRGMALETVKEARWLYDWYRRLGYQTLGAHRYDGSALDTVLMAKPLAQKTP